jgi:undecaprenyl diphosphate synthase
VSDTAVKAIESGAAAAASPFLKDPAALAAVERMRRVSPKADPMGRLPDVHPARIPRHIAIIMDGNGRWAEQRGFPRVFGHRNGASAVRTVIEECGLLGVEALTLYSFSLENWRRPPEEVGGLMLLYLTYLEGERERIMRENMRFVQIGRRDNLPPEVLEAVDRMVRDTAANTGPILCLAVNYGARAEIVDAARALARDAAEGRIDPNAIDEEAVASRLYTAGIPDPDLLIRTAGEMRVSNYLLWQISYAELHVTDVLWPDFGVEQLHAAVRDYAQRRRRFGGLDEDGE